MSYKKRSAKKSRKHLSYKQINFIESKYIDSKLMDFSKFGNFVHKYFNDEIVSSIIKDRLLVQQNTANLHYVNDIKLKPTAYWQKLAYAYSEQIKEIQLKHLHYDATLDAYGYDFSFLSFNICDYIPYVPTIGLLVTKLSNVHEQFDEETIRHELEIAKAYELFLNTVYNKSWQTFYEYGLDSRFYLHESPNCLRIDMFCKFICAISDAIESTMGCLRLNEYENIFIKQTLNVLASFDDNVEICSSFNGVHIRLVHHRACNYYSIIMHKCHKYGGYKKHHTIRCACNSRNWHKTLIAFMFNVKCKTTANDVESALTDLHDTVLSNLHVKLVNYKSNFDEAKFKLKRLNRQCQIINYKQTHFRTFENVKSNLRLGKSNKQDFISTAVNDDSYIYFSIFEQLFARPQTILHSYENFKIEHSRYTVLLKDCIKHQDEFDNINDINEYCRTKGIHYDFALHATYIDMLNKSQSQSKYKSSLIKDTLAKQHAMSELDIFKTIQALQQMDFHKKMLKYSKHLENDFVLRNFCA